MINNFIKKLQKKKIYIISPHLDDAILSCGQLLTELSGKAEIHIINVFTKAHEGPYTLSAKKYLSLSGGYKNAAELFAERKKEDKKAFASLRASVTNLDFQDALFREKKIRNTLGKIIPEVNHLYPLFQVNIMRNEITKNDNSLKELEDALEKIIPSDAIVFAPIALSHHVDHYLVKKACDAVCINIFYYSEFPYNTVQSTKKNNGYSTFSLSVDKRQKDILISSYKTQLHSLFPNLVIPKHQEIYFEKRQIKTEIKIYTRCNKKLELAWQELWAKHTFANLFNSPAWYTSYIKAFKPEKQKILTIYEKGVLTAICPLIEEKKYGITFFKTPTSHYSQRTDILINFNDKTLLALFINACKKLGVVEIAHLKQNEIINLKNVLGVLETESKKTLQFPLFENDKGELLISKRGQILKKARNEEEYITLKDYKENKKEGLTLAFAIDAKSTKHKNKYNVFSNKQMRDFYLYVSKYLPHALGIAILFYKNIPAAYEIGLINGDTYIDSERAYLASHEYYTPGKVMMVKLAERLVHEGYKTLDLGPGIDNFKQSLTTDGEIFTNYLIVNHNSIGKYLICINTLRDKLYHFMFNHRNVYATYRRFLLFLKKDNNN